MHTVSHMSPPFCHFCYVSLSAIPTSLALKQAGAGMNLGLFVMFSAGYCWQILKPVQYLT